MKATGIKATLSNQIAKNSPSIENAKYGGVKIAGKKVPCKGLADPCIMNGTVGAQISSAIKK
jgi:hypothetical protein